MKKILPIVVVGFLVLSGLGTVAVINGNINDTEFETKTEMFSMLFSSPVIKENDRNYVDVQLEETSHYLMHPGQPMIPKIVKTVELPFGVQNVKVDVTPKNVHEYKITEEIRPASAIMPLMSVRNDNVAEYEKDEKVYSNVELFPSDWYTSRVCCGLNADSELVTHVALHVFPVRYAPSAGKLSVADSIDVVITYDDPGSNLLPTVSTYDLVVIAPSEFTDDLGRFIDHKNNYGMKTMLKTTEEIYSEFSGVDKPEQIKYFIKDAIENWGVKYVLLFGGLNSLVFGIPRDDKSQGTNDWHVPVRYNNLYDHPEHPLEEESIFDPGVISDLYYADIYREGGVFEDWDPNGDGIFAAMSCPDVENDTGIDMYPDVYVGRLACRDSREAKTVIEKIINYEQNPADPSWFNKMVVVSGDGFLDQEKLGTQWDTNDLPDGKYTIKAQSKNEDEELGLVDTISVTLDRTVESLITFNHDDHLKITGYPFPPIAEITSPSNGDILGNTDVFYEPTESEAYCNGFSGWANIEYIDGIMHICGKTYDPRAYGAITDIHVWVENEEGQTVFSEWKNGFKMYYEGEWVTGERLLNGGGGALYYMPDDFEKVILWTSNGLFTGQQDVINEISKGCGFAFLSGHGSPMSWGDHYPGVPGNRQYGSITGLLTINYFGGPPYFPMNKLSNNDKLPVLVVGGCHNSQFNVSFLTTLLHNRFTSMWTWLPTPECWSWWLVKLPQRGAIATIGNTGLGYGTMGEDCTIGGLDGGISLDFFRHYGELGLDILGETYGQTIADYVETFDMEEDDHIKSVQQWVLLGDPSLKIGGYSSQQKLKPNICYDAAEVNPGTSLQLQASASDGTQPYVYHWDLDNDGVYDDATGETVDNCVWDTPGVYWVSVKVTDGNNNEAIYDTIVDVQKNQPPDTPSQLSGSTTVKPGISFRYITSAADSYGDNLYYLIDWGDDTESVVGPYYSGEEISASHTWSKHGSYTLKVKAFDTYAQESDWSEPLSVSMPKNKINTMPLILRFLQQHPVMYPLFQQLIQL